MNSFRRFLLPVLCFVLLAASAPVYADSSSASQTDSSASASRIEDVLKLIQSYYLRNVTEEDLVKAAIQGMLDALDDPYSEYFTAAEAEEFFNYINGTDYELGLYLKAVDSRIKVTEVQPGSAAEKAGVRAGDFVVSLNGKKVTVDNFAKAYYEALPKDNSGKLTVEVLRGIRTVTCTLDLTKVEYPLATASLFSGNIGYISLNSFAERTVTELDKGLADLRAKGMKSLILDLRGNGGGDVQAAEDIAKRFIKEGTFVFLTDNTGELYEDKIEGGTPIGVPVYLLVDENTASASEMLAGMLQDHGVAKLIGTTTYGKGVIQQVQEFEPDGAMLKLTTYEYFTPLKHEVNEVGITPDIEADDPLSQLFTALREAGAARFTTEIRKDSYTVNGVSFDLSIPVVQKNGKTYVMVRLAAPALGARAEWKGGKSQTLTLTKAGKTASFPLASGKAIQQNGYTFLDVSELARLYPGFTWKKTADGFLLTTAN
ncbi:S41 family peptidase [Gorillibacterium sp. sgz500922]|uniref:S41 family peptidase n=1 Tax=Gorillibacterium sp. sgz500922 TaxID=3446694 RepID=UPI003F6755E4